MLGTMLPTSIGMRGSFRQLLTVEERVSIAIATH